MATASICCKLGKENKSKKTIAIIFGFGENVIVEFLKSWNSEVIDWRGQEKKAAVDLSKLYLWVMSLSSVSPQEAT